jgi:hypothetical protein
MSGAANIASTSKVNSALGNQITRSNVRQAYVKIDRSLGDKKKSITREVK